MFKWIQYKQESSNTLDESEELKPKKDNDKNVLMDRYYSGSSELDLLISKNRFYLKRSKTWLHKILFVCNGNINHYRAILRLFVTTLIGIYSNEEVMILSDAVSS